MATFEVTDATFYTDANGTYTENGTYNSKTAYINGAGYHMVWSDMFGDQWYIAYGGQEPFYQIYWTTSSDSTPPTGQWSGFGDYATVAAGGPPPPAPPDTRMLLHFDGTGTTITDETARHTPAISGNGTQSADQYKWGKSLYQPDKNSSLDVTDTLSDFAWTATGAATLDFWFYMTEDSSISYIYCTYANNSNDLYYAGGKFYMRLGAGANWDWTADLNNWHHFAMVKEAGAADSIKIYIDGSALTRNTGTFSAGFTISGGGINFFRRGSGEGFKGYIDEVRWSGVARWTENFTPPAVPYSLQSKVGPFPTFLP